MSLQAFGILAKVAEVGGLLNEEPTRRAVIHEVHPEVCFYFLNGRQPLVFGKKKRQGREERLALLRSSLGIGVDEAVARRSELRCEADDIVDALVGLWTAERISRGESLTIPAAPPCDTFGIRMEMVA